MRYVKAILFSVIFLSVPLFGKSYGPFLVEKIEGKFLYFSGPDVAFLKAGHRYRILKLPHGPAPKSINDVVPAGKCVLYSTYDRGGILSFPESVTGEFKKGEYFLLLRGRKLDLAIEKVEVKPVVKTLYNLRGNISWFSPEINFTGGGASLEVMNVVSHFGLVAETGYYFNEFTSSAPEELAVCSGSSCYYATWYVSIFVGLDRENFSLLIGPIIGVVNNVNAYGFNLLMRYGSPFKTFFKGTLRILSRAELYELGVDGRVALGGGYGSGVAMQYRLSSYPDLESANNFLSVGYSYSTRELIVNLLIGFGMAEKDKRGVVTTVEFSHLF